MTDRLSGRCGWALLAALFLAALTACGGGGGGGSNGGGGNPPGSGGNPPPGSGTGNNSLPPQLTYTGIMTQATLDAESSPLIASALLYEIGLAYGERPLPTGKAQQPRGPSKLSRKFSKTRRLIMQAVTTEPCPGGGSLQIDDQTNASGIGTIRFTSTACIEGGVRSEGVVVFDIAAFDLTEGVPTDFTASFYGYSETFGDSMIDMGGSLRTVSTPQSSTATYNTVTRYRPQNVEYRLQNMVVQETPGSSQESVMLQLQGRIFHSALGYVDVTTRDPLGFTSSSFVASVGTLRLQGVASATLDVSFTGSNQMQLLLDHNGDGAVDQRLQAADLEQLTMANHRPVADAGPPVTGDEGQPVQLTGSGADWEGDALTFEWAIFSGPMSSGVIGSGAQVSFTPTAPGLYVIELRVNDGQPFVSTDTMLLTVRPNQDPIARAGPDAATVEGRSVVLDAGASTDVENDPIEFSWTLVSAPAGSTAPASVDGQTWTLVPDRAGIYEYRLQAADPTGASFDNVRITADHVISFGFNGSIDVDPATTLAATERSTPVNVSSFYSGPAVALSAATNVPWLEVVSAPASTASSTELVVNIIPEQFENMSNGTHVAQVTVSPAGYTPRTVQLALNITLPRIDRVAPYVAYEGDASPVTLYGDQLQTTVGASLIINGVEVQGFTDQFQTHARITLPVLPVGEYDMYVQNALGIERPGGRFVVREEPTYPDSQFDLAGRPDSIDYDMERDAFFIVTRDFSSNPSTSQAHRLHYDGTQWQSDPIPVASPVALSLNADGSRLFVTSANCTVTELQPNTLTVVTTHASTFCASGVFEMVRGLADGRVLVGDTNAVYATMYELPGFRSVLPAFPDIGNPIDVLNHTREWLIWAEPSYLEPVDVQYVHLYNVATRSFQQVTMPALSTSLMPGSVAISGDGRRFIHSDDVYQGTQYIGTLQSVTTEYPNPALTRDGQRAIVFDHETETLSVFDLTSGPDFPLLTTVGTLPDDLWLTSRMRLLPNDRVAFIFGTQPNGTRLHRLYVRNLP